MDKETNRLLAIKYLTESVFRTAYLEGFHMTYPETQVICDGYGIDGHTIDAVNTVFNIKTAYSWILDNTDSKIDAAVLCHINGILCNHIEAKEDTVSNKEVDAEIASILKPATIDSALDLFCYLSKQQLFSSLNLSTAIIATNLFMIQNGLGIFSVPVNLKDDFLNLLNDSNSEIKEFLKNN